MNIKTVESIKEPEGLDQAVGNAATAILDLRSAIECLKQTPGQLLVCNEPVDPNSELAGVYRRVGAGTPVEPPTKEGPAMLFENVIGYDIPVITGVLASLQPFHGQKIDALVITATDADNSTVHDVAIQSRD